VDLETWVRK